MSSLGIVFCILGNNGGLSSISGNRGVYGTSGNPVSSSSLHSFYQQNQGQLPVKLVHFSIVHFDLLKVMVGLWRVSIG
jgi:hypothetical protein